MSGAQASVPNAAEQLWQSVVELAVTVFEDHPQDADLAFVDDLMERVSEFQGAVSESRVAAVDDRLSDVDTACDRAGLLYWRDLMGFRTIYELRRAAARRPGEWRAWTDGVELALDRCSQPLQDLRAAIRLTWTAGPRQPIGSTALTNDSRRSE